MKIKSGEKIWVVFVVLGVLVIGVSIGFSLAKNKYSPTPVPQVFPSPTEVVTPSQSPTIMVFNYPKPAAWKIVTIEGLGLKICLPPKWEADKWGNIYFNRDPGYKPSVTYMQTIPYNGGSRREAYLKYLIEFEGYGENIRDQTKFTEVGINGNTVLLISRQESGYFKASSAVLWFTNKKLWLADVSGWSMVNDSELAFLKDFYTMIGCSF